MGWLSFRAALHPPHDPDCDRGAASTFAVYAARAFYHRLTAGIS